MGEWKFTVVHGAVNEKQDGAAEGAGEAAGLGNNMLLESLMGSPRRRDS